MYSIKPTDLVLSGTMCWKQWGIFIYFYFMKNHLIQILIKYIPWVSKEPLSLCLFLLKNKDFWEKIMLLLKEEQFLWCHSHSYLKAPTYPKLANLHKKGKKKKCGAKKKSHIYIYSCNVLENYHNIILFYLNMKIDYYGNYLQSFLWLYLDMKLCVIASSVYYYWVCI